MIMVNRNRRKSMKIHELMDAMGRCHPDTEVLVWVGDDLCPITKIDRDCSHPAGPWVFTIDTTQDKATVEAVAAWLDGAGQYPPMPADPFQAVRENKLRLVANVGDEQAAA
jgi:hypothetical protein